MASRLAISVSRASLAETMSLDIFERAVNDLSDKDSSWWPFLWLRPDKSKRLSLTRLTSIALLYGLPCGAALSVLLAIMDARTRSSAPVPVVAFPILFLFVGSVVIGPAWNRRADRLQSGDRSE